MIFAIGRGFMMSPDLMDELMAELQGNPLNYEKFNTMSHWVPPGYTHPFSSTRQFHIRATLLKPPKCVSSTQMRQFHKKCVRMIITRKLTQTCLIENMSIKTTMVEVTSKPSGTDPYFLNWRVELTDFGGWKGMTLVSRILKISC